MDLRISLIPTVNVPIKSKPASRILFFVTEYCNIASSPDILLMGEKKRWAPFGTQSIHLSSSYVGIPCSVLCLVCRTHGSLISSGKKNFAPSMAENDSLMIAQRLFRTFSGPYDEKQC